MYFAGHMAMGYLVGKITGKRLNLQVSDNVLFIMSILPDIDLFLSGFGIEHGTVTHSFTLWTLPFLASATFFGVRSVLPYWLALTVHFSLGDLAFVPTPVLWGIFDVKPTLGLGITTLEHALVESFLLVVFLVYVFKHTNEERDSVKDRFVRFALIALIIILTIFVTFSGGDPLLNPLQTFSLPNVILLVTNLIFLLCLTLPLIGHKSGHRK